MASQTVTGTLKNIDPAVDGPGLYYETDAAEPMIFKNEFSDYYTQYLHHKEWVGIHTVVRVTRIHVSWIPSLK